MTSLTELRERAERATGGSRELDARIWHALHPTQQVTLDHGKATGPGRHRPARHGPLSQFPIDGWEDWKSVALHIGATEITASIDAALALVEAKLPGYCVLMAFNSTKARARADIHSEPLGSVGTWTDGGNGATLALAILSALLRALEAKEQSGG